MKSPHSRRKVVGSAAAALTLGLAGCTDESPEDVESISVSNWHADPHTVSLSVAVDGKRRISQTVEVESVTKEDDRTVPGRVTIEKTLPGPGFLGERRYEVTAALDGGPPKTRATTTGEGFDSIEVEVGEGSELDIGFADAV